MMKAIGYFVALLGLAVSCQGAIVAVTTSGNTFSPTGAVGNPGDSVQWTLGGTHNAVQTTGTCERFVSLCYIITHAVRGLQDVFSFAL